MNAPTLTLEQILPMWISAKQAEQNAIEERRRLDKIIESLLPKQEEGSVSAKTDDYKVSVIYKVSRKVDAEKLSGMWPSMSEQAQKAFKWSADVSISELRKLQEYRPEDYAFVAAAITAKPASPSVSVELINKEK